MLYSGNASLRRGTRWLRHSKIFIVEMPSNNLKTLGLLRQPLKELMWQKKPGKDDTFELGFVKRSLSRRAHPMRLFYTLFRQDMFSLPLVEQRRCTWFYQEPQSRRIFQIGAQKISYVARRCIIAQKEIIIILKLRKIDKTITKFVLFEVLSQLLIYNWLYC